MNEQAIRTAARLADAIEAKDPFTRGHSRAVSAAALALARELGLKGDHLNLIEAAGLLHDIGYVELDPAILTKPGPLTKDEFERIRMHPTIGAAMVRAIPSLRDAADFVEFHHERCDGGGYPSGARKEDIPIEGRILALAETYDALTAHRAHRPAFSPVKVIRGLKTAARAQLDPDLVEALLAVVGRVAGVRSIETLPEMPALDSVVWEEQRRLRAIYEGISSGLSAIIEWILGRPANRILEKDINEMLHRGGIQLSLSDGDVEDRLPSRLHPSDLATEYRAALAQQIAQVEQWVGSRLTRFYLSVIFEQLGAEAAEVARAYNLCEVPAFNPRPLRISDSPLVLAR